MIPPGRRRRSLRRLAPAAGAAGALLTVGLMVGLMVGLVVGTGPAASAASPQEGPVTGLAARSGLAVRAAASAAVADEESGPLTVTLTTMSPSSVPKKGPLLLSGSVRNDSDEDWRDINVHAFVSLTPMTTPAELAAAVQEPYDAEVGDRLTTSNAFVGIGDLAPGDSTTFSLRVPRDELRIPDEPGVYWVGAHALGANDEGRDGIADGRARTFIPLIDAKKPQATLSLVVPLRGTVRRDADFALRDSTGWKNLLADTGRMERLVALSETAGSDPFTLVMDPAVLDAVDTVAHGTKDTAPPTPTPTANPSPTEKSGTASTEPAKDDPDAERAVRWLDRVKALAAQQRVLGLGYGDPDVAALTRRSPALLGESSAQSSARLERYGIAADPAVAPADGRLPVRSLSRFDAGTTFLLDDAAAPGSAPYLRTAEGQPIVLADSAAATGGPGPTPATAALAMRQRIVSEAALRALSGSAAPLVVSLPPQWDPGPDWQAADFFGGLDKPWLRLAPLGSGGIDEPAPTTLAYPPSVRRAQIGQRQVDAAKSVERAARVYADALTSSSGVADAYQRLALEGTSYHARADAGTALDQSTELARSIRQRLTGIRVVGSSFVTTSGLSGRFVVTLVNDLDQPVRVGLAARTSADLKITSTPRTVVLPAGQRTTVRLRANATRTGVRAVVLTPVTREGDAVGTPIRFSMRSSQVSSLIWGVMAGAFTLLVVMIVRRAVKRGLRRENTPG